MIDIIDMSYFRQRNNKKSGIPVYVTWVFTPLFVFFVNVLPEFAHAQHWQLDPGSPPEVVVTGTSTLHDWKATCAGVTGVPETLMLTGENTINEFEFKIPVDSMDGGRGATMNRKIRDAFKSTENPFIIYRQTEPTVLSEITEGKDFDFTSKGMISLAGLEKPVTVSGKGTMNNGLITLTASKELKMTDFEMEPPSAMFGQIRTHDEVVVNFIFHYKQANNE